MSAQYITKCSCRALLFVSAPFGSIMEQGSPAPRHKSGWQNVRNLTGIDGSLYMRAVMSAEAADAGFDKTIQSKLASLRYEFLRGEFKQSLHKFRSDFPDATVQRILLEDFATPRLQKSGTPLTKSMTW